MSEQTSAAFAVRLEGGVLRVSGDMNRTQAAAARDAVGAAGETSAVEAVDLAGVAAVDSAALALLLAWRRRFGEELRIDNAPPSLHALAGLVGLEGWLFGAP